MKTTIRHIEYLLSRTDCVIIPGLGAILATNHSAMYDPLTHTILPPSRSYTFNAEIRHNDGVLITSVQRAEGISYEAARHKVSMAVDDIINQLASCGTVEIGSLGCLNRDSVYGSITLDTYTTAICAEAMWLQPMYLRPVGADSNVIAAPIAKGSSFKRWLRAAASLAVLLFIGFVASTPLPVDDAMLASLAPDFTQLPVEDILPPKSDDATTDIDIATVVEEAVSAEEAVTVEEAVSTEEVHDSASQTDIAEAADNTDNDSHRYYVVVASLANDKEADLYMQMHPGADLKILQRGRYIRVYTSAHDNLDEAYKASQEASKSYPGAWVCKK